MKNEEKKSPAASIITMTLVTTSALHVGGTEGNNATDALLRRNAAGELFIPGSAIAGPLRALATRLTPRLEDKVCQALTGLLNNRACGCMTCLLFGDINPQEGNNPQTWEGRRGGKASALWVADAKLYGIPTIRDGVGIDRVSGAAARQGAVKFDLEVLPAGIEIELRFELRPNADQEHIQNQRLLAVVLAEWGKTGRLGGRVARGLGAFKVQDLRWQGSALDTRPALMAFLRRQGPITAQTDGIKSQETLLEEAREVFEVRPFPKGDPSLVKGHRRSRDLAAFACARTWVEAKIILSFEGPMLINDLVQARKSGFDHAPLSDHREPKGRWVLPGSSLRGVLRSQAERIARTLATRAAQDKATFLLRNPAGDPNNSRYAREPLPNSDCLLRAAGIPDEERLPPAFFDLGDRLFGSTRLGSRLIISDGQLVNQPKLKALDFVAIDRFTGGGRDSAKFDALALWQPQFMCHLRLENAETWELGWLLLALRDLHEGLATIGWGRAKGFGQAKIARWTLRIGFLHDDDFPHAETNEGKAIAKAATERTLGLWRVATVADQERDKHSDYKALARHWGRAAGRKIDQFKRFGLEDKPLEGVPAPSLEWGTDSYFGKVDHLYPKEGTLNG